MNLNTFAKKITMSEGKKLNLSIAQVKEVIRLVFEELKKNPVDAMFEIFDRKKK